MYALSRHQMAARLSRQLEGAFQLHIQSRIQTSADAEALVGYPDGWRNLSPRTNVADCKRARLAHIAEASSAAVEPMWRCHGSGVEGQ